MPALSISLDSSQRSNALPYFRRLRMAGLSRPDCLHLIISRYGWPEYRGTARGFLPERLLPYLVA